VYSQYKKWTEQKKEDPKKEKSRTIIINNRNSHNRRNGGQSGCDMKPKMAHASSEGHTYS
jgi:hypothetical protein